MSWRAARRLAAHDLRRHAGRLAVGVAGVTLAVGVAAFTLGLGEGVRRTVLGKIFPLDILEVTPETVELDLFALRFGLGSDTLDPETVADLGALEGVRAVSPRMVVTAPVVATGGLGVLGTRLTTELAVDGLDPVVLEPELADAGFHDPGPPADEPCLDDGDCSGDEWCGSGWSDGDPVCRPVVPALVSRQLVELFNSSLRRSWSLPRLNPDAFIGARLDLRIGTSTLGVGRRTREVRERIRLVGFSDRAMPLGVTVPYGWVERLNAELGGATRPHAAVLVLDDRSDAARTMAELRRRGLEVRDRGSQRAITVVGVLRLAAAALGVALLTVAAVGVLHAMAVLLDARRREIAVLRSVGVSGRTVTWSLVLEASVIGAIAASVGVLLAVVGGVAADQLVARWLPDLPFRPDRLVVITPWLALASVAAGTVAAVAGAWWPVRRATRTDPADGLRPR